MMKLYLYDFDGTIYDGDSSVDFFKFCLKKDKSLILMIPKMLIKVIAYKSKNITVTEAKEYVFSFLKKFDDIDGLVNEFWKEHKNKLKDFYLLKKNKKNDIIISASPYFLLKPICDELGVKELIASDVDKRNGKFNKPNNRGEEKVKELNRLYPDCEIMEMYSDSMHDKPLLELAKKGYLIKGNNISDYSSYKPGLIKKIWNDCWDIYHKNEEMWNYLIVGGLTTVVSIGTYAISSKLIGFDFIISNIISWVCAVVFAYYTNRWFVFHSKNNNMLKEFISFTGSRVLTLLLDTGLMYLFVKLIDIDDLIAKMIIQVIIVIANYVISKLLVFKK